MESYFTGSNEDWSSLGEEIVIPCLTLNGSDQHWVPGILVRLQHYIHSRRGKRGRERKREREREREENTSKDLVKPLANTHSLCLLKRIDWVLSSRTMLLGSGPSVFFADREQRNSYAAFTLSKISYKHQLNILIHIYMYSVHVASYMH